MAACLHGKYFKALVKFSHFGRFLSFNIDFGDLWQFEDLLNNYKLPKNLPKVQLVGEMVTLYRQVNNKETLSKVKEIEQFGLYIRDVFLPNDTRMSWPPKPELCENAVKFPPPKLDAFLCTLW